MSWFKDLFGGSKSAVGGVSWPDYFSDPNYQGSQQFLDQYSKDLLTKGPNDYYKPIGEYGTPEFMDYLSQGNSKTLMGVNDALAKSGRARGGRVGEVASQALGDHNADLLFKDYIRAMSGREMFFNTGLNTQANVRDAGYVNQQARNQFNTDHSNFDMAKAAYQDNYKAQNSAATGKVLGTLIGGGIGFMAGGPAGAMAGAGIGGDLAGSGSSGTSGAQWLEALMGSKKSSTADASSAAGVSDIGKINLKSVDPELLSKIFSSL